MADRKPLKVLPDSASGTGGGDSTGLGEFVAADTIGVMDGGTGAITLAANGILLGNGTSAIAASAAMTTNGTLLIGGTGGPEVATLTAGSNITLTNGDGTITVAAAGGGHTIQEEGSGLTARANLNFVGAAVTATDNGSDTTIVTVTPTGASIPLVRDDGDSDPIVLTSAALGESLVSDTTPQLGGDLDVNGQSIVSDGSNENIPITPHGTGSVVISKADINAGAIDGTAIGAGTPSTIAGTTIDATTDFTIGGTVITDNTITDDGTLAIVTTNESVRFHGAQSGSDGAFASLDGYSTTDSSVLSRISFLRNGADNAGGISFHVDDSSTLNQAMIITNDGKVGIGTQTPIQPLHVVTSAGANITFQLNNDSGENTYTGRRSRGSEASPTAIQSGDTILAFGGEGYDGGTYAGRGGLKLTAAENWTTAPVRGSRWDFYGATTGQGNLDAAWMSMTNGKVGIGNTSPARQLDVTTTTDISGIRAVNTNGSYTNTTFDSSIARASNSAYAFIYGHNNSQADIQFNIRGDGNALLDETWQDNSYDYAEYFENTGTAIEVGATAVLDGGKVRAFNADTDSADDIIGVNRPKVAMSGPSVHGSQWNRWHNKYLIDDYGRHIFVETTCWAWEQIDAVLYEDGDELPEGAEIGDIKTPVREAGLAYEQYELIKDSTWTPHADATSSTDTIRKMNPDYDDSVTYESREERDEWSLIGLVGQVPMKKGETTNSRWIKMGDISDAVERWMIR